MTDELFENQDAVKVIEAMPDDKQIATLPDAPVPQDLTKQEWLMYNIIKSGSIAALEKYIALKERTEEREAKALFDENFAKMQAEFEPVSRSKQGYDYKYAPLDELQKAYGSIISKHGFSYRWREEAIETGKRCIMVISGYGHSEENYFDIPVLAGTKQMNAVQVVGAMSSYGRRYTFIAGFGIIIQDEDNEKDFSGDEVDSIISVSQDIAKINACASMDELSKVFSDVWNALGKLEMPQEERKRRQQLVMAAKDEMKKGLAK